MFTKLFLFATVILCLNSFVAAAENSAPAQSMEPKDFYTFADFPTSKPDVAAFCGIAEADAKTAAPIKCSSEKWELFCKNMIGKPFFGQATIQDVSVAGRKATVVIRKLFFRHIAAYPWTGKKQAPFGVCIKMVLETDEPELRQMIIDGIPRELVYHGWARKTKRNIKESGVKNMPGDYIKDGTLFSYVCKVTGVKVLDEGGIQYISKPFVFKDTLFDFSRPASVGSRNRLSAETKLRKDEGKLFCADLTIEITADLRKWAKSNDPCTLSGEYSEPEYPDISHWVRNEVVRLKRARTSTK
jgi:hypothetical protein